ncbi:MAG TPA: tyrosine--tRNA ligase, partial [Lachnospiraceae bacterium]|nr:tyrosine--tRNA ligase [Lachnospiraceae bacterium]
DEDFKDGVTDILQLLVAAKLCPTRSDARRLVQQGGVTVDDVKVTDFRQSYTRDDLKDGLVLKKGKKAFRRIVL